MNLIDEFQENPFLFLRNINDEIISNFKEINKDKSRSYKIYYGKKIINKIVKERGIIEKIIGKKIKLKKDILMPNKIKIGIIKDILSYNEIKLIKEYFFNGMIFSFSDFQNIIFYLEKIIRYLYLKVCISSARHVGNQVLHYGELSNLIKKYDGDNVLNLYFSCLMLPEGFNIRNKTIHGEYTDAHNFNYEMFLLLLMTEIILNINDNDKYIWR